MERQRVIWFWPRSSTAERVGIATGRRAGEIVLRQVLDLFEAQGHDLATMPYEWRVGSTSGRFVDAAYPAVLPDRVDRLEEALLQLEEAATGTSG